MSIFCVRFPSFFSRSWITILSTKVFKISGVNSSMRVYFLVAAISLETLVISVSASLTSAVKVSISCSDSQCYVTALKFKTMLPYASRKGRLTFAAVNLVRWLHSILPSMCAYLILIFQFPYGYFRIP